MTTSKLSSSQIRSDFLEFFRGKGHTIVPSAPLVPGNDPTLLFTNSGMVQFKDVFLGAEKRSYVRAADVQRCLRAGGKHNDLDQVGYTARHHTFFEMLGNWSFGDYFKQDAIAWAWELLTDIWKLPKERLLVTVYHTDDEAFDIWHKQIGLPVERIIRIGDNKGAPYASDNFWQMADTGPCGPCTEIFYDHGEQHAGGPPGSPDEDGDRYIEIWNLVFMQFDKQPDGSLQPLPAPCVDTGMGLERLVAVLQHTNSNYEIDLFQKLVHAAAKHTRTADLENKSLRVIADHIRACSFLIVDGVLPSNEGRGYVLRRIIRRALRHGWMLGVREPFFHQLVATLDEVMGEAYPELSGKRELVERALKAEEERFAETLSAGMARLENETKPERLGFYAALQERGVELLGGGFIEAEHDESHSIAGVVLEPSGQKSLVRSVAFKSIQGLLEGIGTVGGIKNSVERGAFVHEFVYLIPIGVVDGLDHWWAEQLPKMQAQGYYANVSFFPSAISTVLNGRIAFILYDTYGFPVDLTADIARERGLEVDMAGFEAAMQQQRETARAAGKFASGTALPAELVAQFKPTEFLYDTLTAGGLEVVALLKDGRPVDAVNAGDDAIVFLDRTPFYAESGGQVGDTGELDEQGVRFEVRDTQKFAGQFHGHIGHLTDGTLKRGDRVLAAADSTRRAATILNHSGTHLLHSALRQLLGTHVMQKGSLVAPDRLRFDFSHFQPVTAAELAELERRVNAEIRSNHQSEIHTMGMQEALDFGAMALFGEKYGERVRVLRMGETSTELCGGTHVVRTGDIGLFKIVSEGGVSAGVRRIEAVTGQGALDHIATQERRLDDAARLLGASAQDIVEKAQQLTERQRRLEREIEALKAKAASGATSDLAGQAQVVEGIRVLATRLEGFDAKALRDAMDRLKQQLGDAVIVLAGASDGKASLVAGVSGAALGKVKAGELLAQVAARIGGKGGGRPDLAQGGGDDGPLLVEALAGVYDWVLQKLR